MISNSADLRGRLMCDASLADYTSWRTGGLADYLYLPADLADLSRFLAEVPKDMPITWLGLGSNTLVRDGGVSGVVIITQGHLKTLSVATEGTIRAEAGVASAQLARFSARAALQGLEFMAGIPGTVGGALQMNAGCFGGETWQHVEAVEMINRAGVIKKLPKEDFNYTYRHVECPEAGWFVAGHFKLSNGDKQISLEKIRALLEKRTAAQPTGTLNCGSVFRNPDNAYAGQLIESCGLKGKRIGNASVSEKHGNFIINEGEASSADIENLITCVQDEILQKTGVQLIAEVCIIGRNVRR